MTPDYSVVVPVYNVEEYLSQCVDSLLAQRYGNFEVILVDDGSSDGSGALCDRYAARDSRVRVIHQPNRGVVAARLAALEAARGTYACFVDGDDWVTPEWLETVQARVTETGGPDMIQFDFASDDGSPSQPLLAAPGYYDKARLEREVYPYMIWDRRRPFLAQLIPGYQCTKIVRRTLLLDHYIRDAAITLYEDVAMLYECLYHANSLYVCPEAFYIYRQRSGSALRSYDPNELRQLKACRNYLLGHLVRQAPELAPQAEGFIASKLLRAILQECRRGAPRDAVRHIAGGLDETGLARDLSTEGLPAHIRLFLLLLRHRAYRLALLIYRIRLWFFDRRHI